MDRPFTPWMHFLSQFLKKLPFIYIYIYIYICVCIFYQLETRLLYWNTALHDKRSLLMKILLLLLLYPEQNDRGSTVAKVLCCKSEGRWFDPSWCHWNFSLT